MSRALPSSTREFLGIGDDAGRDNFAATDPSFGRREDAAPFPMPGNPQNVDLDSFDEKTRKERAAIFRAAGQELFRTDVSKLDDAGAWGLYHAVTESMFGLADEDGSVAFGKRAAKDPRQNIEMLRRFVKGEYTLIEDPEYTKWREMNDEEKFKYALENETKTNKIKSNLKGERGASFWEMAAMSGMSSAPWMQLPAEERSDIVRRSNYETLTDEEKEKYRADVVADYDEKLSRRQTLATFLQFSQGLSDRASWMLAKSFNDGVPDSNIETLPEDERDRVYSAFSLMRGDQKKGSFLGILPMDFTDDTAANRLQLMLYGFQQSVLGLATDTWDMAKNAAIWTYAKTALSESERKDFFDWWNAQARMEQAMKQNLPEAEGFWGEAFQGVAENSHWIIPYSMIGKGGKMVAAARGLKEADVTLKGWKKVFQPLKDLQIMLRPMPLGGTLKGEKTMAEASKAIAEAQVAATKAAYTLDINGVKKLGDYGKTLVARQMAAVEHFTQTLRGIDKDLEAAKWWKDAAGTGMWAMGEAQAFSAFASEYISNADAAGISREESVLTAAAIGLINAKIEKLYVPGLEASLSPAQIKSLTFAAMAQAIRSDGAAGFRKWLANRVAYGVREGVKVAATEGLVEEPLQQMAIEHGKAFDKLCQELRENGNATAANEAKALWDSIAATLPQDYATFVDTAVDMLPSSVGFGVTTIGNMTRRQHIQNVMVRHANRRAGSTSTMGTAQSMEELMGATDYDAGVVDMIQRAVGVRNAMEQHWQGEGGEGQNNPHRFEEAITAARQAFRNSQGGDVVREVAQAAGVDVKTAEVLTQYFQVETEAAAFSPTVRAWTALNMSLADIDEQTIKTILPGYVEGSFAADPEAGVYSGKVKLADGSERTIAYKVGDISEELMKQAEVNSKVNSAFGRSWDARIEENNSRGIVDGAIAADMTRKWAELSDQERYMAAVRAQASVNGFSSGTSGVFELTDARGEKVRVNADDIIYLASGRIADIGYGAAATQGTVRHETFHSLWRFARASLDDADVQALAKTLGVDVTKDGWEVELDEKMAHQMERYASGHYVSHAVSSRFDKMLDGWAGKLVNFFGKIGQRDEVMDPNTGKPYQLKNLYDRVLRGELGSGALGVELVKIPEQPAGEAAATKSAMPVEVTDAERAAAEEEMRQSAGTETAKPGTGNGERGTETAKTETQTAKTETPAATPATSVPVATSESPADASTPNQRYYRVGLPNSNVKLVGRLEVRDSETGLVTSTDADYHDRGNQNRDDKSEESRALVEKIGANPDPLQVGTVQPIASNGIVWALPNGDVIIGNHRVNGVRLGYEKGTTGELEKFVREDAAKRGIEIGENVKKPITVFVLERIESPDGTLDKAGFDEQVHEVVRLANESQNRGFNVREQAANDAKILVDNNLLPRMVFRADGRIDETKSGDAIGKFRSETGAQGMIAEDGSLTEEGQTRIQNAALAALLGRGENAALLQKIMANAGRLDMQNELRALMKMTPELMSLAEAKPAYDLRAPLADALQLFTEWRDKDETARVEKGKTRHDWRETAKDGHRVRGISWEQFMSQGDMFRTPSDEAKILGDLFARAEAERSFDREDVESAVGKKRAIDLISNYLTDYIENARAVNTETEDIFGGAPASRAEVMAAQRVNPAGGVRFSVDPAKVRPATKEEYDAALSTWGDMKIDAGNVASAGWIFPDGRVLKPKMQRTAFGMMPHHDSLFAFLERPERSNDVEKFEYGYADSLAGGAVRLNLGNGGIEVMRLPTAEQLDTLYDALDAGYGLMEDEGEDVLRVDVDRENGSTAFTAQYRRGTSARRIMDDLREWFESAKVPDAAANARFSISGIYTGSAADYDKPSLHYVGSGEGSQVYGWGLYGSNVRGVAEGYAEEGTAYRSDAVALARHYYKDYGSRAKAYQALFEETKNLSAINYREKMDALWMLSGKAGTAYKNPLGNLYEQTWFTNREPGDESHLLKWYEPVSKEQREWITKALEDGKAYKAIPYLERRISDIRKAKQGERVYHIIEKVLGSPQTASEFLYRAGIDGVKYPVDSYGKTVKDGDEAGWNHVAFSDEHIRVDHKWTDGQQRFSIARPATKEEIDRIVEHFGTTRNINEAGYILPDGRMLDLSDRKNGAPGGRRSLDHRDVWDVLDDRENGGDAMADFVSGGAIRLQPEAYGVMFGAKPTEAQEAVLVNYFARFNGEMNVDIMAPNGDFVSSASYAEGTRPQRILNEVKRYYDEGTELSGTGEQADGSFRFSIYAAGKYAGSLRSLAHGIKEGDEDAIVESAGRMVALVPNNAVLVPIPGHLGRARTTMRLAQAIAALKPGVSVVDALEAEPHESNYDQKKRLHKPPKDVNMWRRAGVEIPEGRPVYFVDNVVASGSTYYAAQKAIPGADIITLADTMKQMARELPTLDEIDAISKQKKAALQGWREKYEANRTEKNFDSYTKAFSEYVDAVAAAYDSRHPDETVPHGRNKIAGVVYPDASGEIENIRFSIGAKRRGEYARILEKYRPDLRADAIIGELEKFGDTKKEKVALHWIVSGGLELPEDAYKVDDAISVAEKAKVDPFKYRSPDELMLANKEFKPSAKPIDPDTVPELSDKRDESDGVVSYQVQDDRAGQAAMRRIIDTHWGEDANPWCLLARKGARKVMTREFRSWLDKNHSEWPLGQSDATIYAWSQEFEKEGGRAYRDATEGELLENAWNFWNQYNALPKRVAFKDGKLLAFMATEGVDTSTGIASQYDLSVRLPELFKEYINWSYTDEGKEEAAEFAEWLEVNHPEDLESAMSAEEWWDRKDESHTGPNALREIANPDIRYSVSSDLVDAMRRRASADNERQNSMGQDARFGVEPPGFKYPNPLNALSDDELIAAAVAARMALGKSDKISDRAVKINTVQQLMRRLHPDWTDTDIGRESNRIVSDARKLGKKIREDLDRGVSESLILEHLPDAAREQFGREMREEARKGQRLGVFAQRVKGEIEERQARMIDDAVRVQTGLDVANIENAYGINLSETIMHLAENPLAEKPPKTMNGSAGEESAASAEGLEGESAEGAAEIDAKVKAAVNDILAASRTAAEADERNRKDRRAAAGRAEERKAEAGESGDEGSDAGDALGEGDFLVNAVKKEGVDLKNPRHLARFVAELARRQWIKDHGLKQNAEVWRDLVAVQFLRKTAQSVYAKLCRDLTYSRGRETAMQHIARFDAAPTVAGLMSEMEFVGALINARRIRDTQQQKCEQLDLFLRERFGAQGRFKPDKEEGKRKVSAEAELRARYMRHAMWLTPDAAAEEARQLQETLNALSVDFKDAGRDVDQSREFVETIRKLNVLREFGALRYKPIGDIDAAAQWWEDFERGSSDDIVREMSDRDIRTKKAAHLLALAFADPKRKTVREGDTLSDKLSRFITGHMGFVALLQDCMRFAPDADVAAVQDILGYISREVQKSGDRTEAEKRRHNNAFASAVESIYGKNVNAVMKDMATTDERFTEFMGEVGGKRVMPTKGRAMQLLVSLLQEGRKVQVEDEDNPGQMKTVWEGGYHDNIVKHKREGQAQKIMRLLTPADMNMIKWLGQWYEQNRSELSDVCKSLFGIGVYAELPNYFPVKMLLEKQGLEKGEGVGWTIFPKALTPRVKNERDFDTSMDIFSMWASRMEEGAQWKHHAQLGLEMRGIFGRAELQAAVIANHGKNVNELMQGFITDILAGHGAYDRSTAGVEYFSDQIRGWTALCALGGNIGVMFKQTTSIPAFGFEIGLVNTAKYTITAFTPEGMAAMLRIWDSEQRQTRWQVGSSEAIRNALMQRDASILKRMLQASMITTKIGDVVPALVVGQGIYRDCLERGMSDEDAMAETWSIIERTQQSGRMENQTSIQRRNKLGRLLFQFLSTQQQYLQYEAKTIREVIAKPLSVKRWQKMGSAIFLAHFILPTMYFWMGELYKACLGQEPPEDELKDWLVTCLLGPLGSLVVAGFCCKYTLERAIKGYSWKSPSMLPMESFMKNQINDASKLMEAIFDAEGNTWDEVLDAVGRWISDSNSTVRDLRKLYRFRVKEEPQNRR